MDAEAPLAWGNVSPRLLSSSLYLSSFAIRWTVPVPMPSDLATFKIPRPFASCCRTFRSVALSIFGQQSFTGQPIRADVQLARQIIVDEGFAGLFRALKAGAALPAVAFVPLIQLLQQG